MSIFPESCTHAQRLYLSALRSLPTPIPRLALRLSNTSPPSLCAWRKERWFVEAEQTAMQESSDILLAAATSAAVDGRDIEVYHEGVVVGTRKEYSEKLMVELLKAFRPEFAKKPTSQTTNNVVLASPAQIAEVVKRLSPTNGNGQQSPQLLESASPQSQSTPAAPRPVIDITASVQEVSKGNSSITSDNEAHPKWEDDPAFL